jgi:putative CocE/NonD family hydrolase
MTLASEVLGRKLSLPRALSRDVAVHRDLEMPMDDGTLLLADRYAPPGAGPMPTVLVRSPYGRRGLFGFMHGRLLAERGLQVLMQSVRGTDGSGGEFTPFDERADGLATVAWLQRQPWHAGKIGMVGPSYLGNVQWAVARDAADALGALSISASASSFHPSSYGAGLALQQAVSWNMMMAVQDRPWRRLRALRALSKVPKVIDELPLDELDRRILGRSHPLYQNVFKFVEAADPYWQARSFTATVGEVTAPVQLIAGWFDIFTRLQLEDYVALRRAGHEPRLIVGPWLHTSPGFFATSVREDVAWMRTHLLDDRRPPSAGRVHIHVGGADEWRTLADWPPPDAREWRLHLQPSGGLGPHAPGVSPPDRYRYDPADPTPSLGGPDLPARHPVVDNAPLERRRDVLSYTSAPLDQAVEAIGNVRADVHVRSSLEHFDVFVRICDVDRAGVSRNVCDALARVAPERAARAADGTTRVEFELWPTAHRFAVGHRIRIQVSSGAHPRYARNLGTGEPIGTGRRMLVADQQLFHDPEHPSGVVLSVVGRMP